jgi:hypothetical protein
VRNLILVLLFALNAFGLTDVDRQELLHKNILSPYNPGFENGKSSWTIGTDTISTVSSGSNLLLGKGSITWDSAGAARILASKAITIPKGLYGSNGYAQCKIQTPSGTATHTLSVYDGTNTLVSSTITSSTLPTYTGVNFIFPSSGTIQLRMTSVAADEPLIAIDDCYIGAAFNITQVSQASYYGGTDIYATGVTCAMTATTGGANADLTTDADCTLTNFGFANTTTKTYYASFPSLPPGKYLVEANFTAQVGTAASECAWQLSDGTNLGNEVKDNHQGTARLQPHHLEYPFTYSNSQGATTFRVIGRRTAGTGSCDIYGTDQAATIHVWRFPTTSEQAFRADASPASWSGYHDTTCSWSRTNVAYGDPATDASCALVERTNTNFGSVTGSNDLPKTIFTPTKSGKFYICADISIQGSSLAATLGFKLWDGTTTIAEADWQVPVAGYGSRIPLCGIYNATNTSSKTLSIQTKASAGSVSISNLTAASVIEWQIFALDQSFPSPYFVGAIVANTQANVMEFCVVEYQTTVTTTTAPTRNYGNCFGSITRSATGTYSQPITAGVFSAAPTCSATSNNATNGSKCNTEGSATTTAVTVKCYAAGGSTLSDERPTITCYGPH